MKRANSSIIVNAIPYRHFCGTLRFALLPRLHNSIWTAVFMSLTQDEPFLNAPSRRHTPKNYRLLVFTKHCIQLRLSLLKYLYLGIKTFTLLPNNRHQSFDWSIVFIHNKGSVSSNPYGTLYTVLLSPVPLIHAGCYSSRHDGPVTA